MQAAVVHDVAHPGLNNDFFNKTNAEVAHRYFGKAVLAGLEGLESVA